MTPTIIKSVTTVSGFAGGTTGEAEVVLLIKGTADTVEVVRELVANAVIPMPKVKRDTRERIWDPLLTLDNARQADIERGDIVRSYDFPGSRDDVFVEGVAKTIEDDRILIHVTREMWAGEEQQVERFEVWAPLGVSSITTYPCVFLQAKRVVKS